MAASYQAGHLTCVRWGAMSLAGAGAGAGAGVAAGGLWLAGRNVAGAWKSSSPSSSSGPWSWSWSYSTVRGVRCAAGAAWYANRDRLGLP
jgi:hypothetical protein